MEKTHINNANIQCDIQYINCQVKIDYLFFIDCKINLNILKIKETLYEPMYVCACMYY